jgi:hypothetical protein
MQKKCRQAAEGRAKKEKLCCVYETFKRDLFVSLSSISILLNISHGQDKTSAFKFKDTSFLIRDANTSLLVLYIIVTVIIIVITIISATISHPSEEEDITGWLVVMQRV